MQSNDCDNQLFLSEFTPLKLRFSGTPTSRRPKVGAIILQMHSSAKMSDESRIVHAPKALLITSTSWFGFSRFPRMVKDAGVAVDLICLPEAVVASSTAVDRLITVSGGIPALCEKLREHLRLHRSEYSWIVVGDDELFRAVSVHFSPEEANDWFAINVDSPAVDFFESKLDFLARCDQMGLPVAKYRIVNSTAEAEAAAAEIGFPMVAKLSISTGGSGVVPFQTKADFDERLPQLKFPFALQAFVTGRPFATEVIFDRGVPVCWTMSEQINRWPKRFSPSSARRLIDEPDMRHILTEIGKYTGYHGCGSIDAIIAEDGVPYLSEMNPRPGPGFSITPENSAAFSAAIGRMARGATHPHYTWKTRVGYEIALYPESVFYALDKPLSYYRWRLAFQAMRAAFKTDPVLARKATRVLVRQKTEKYRIDRPLRAMLKKVVGR